MRCEYYKITICVHDHIRRVPSLLGCIPMINRNGGKTKSNGNEEGKASFATTVYHSYIQKNSQVKEVLGAEY